MAFIHSVHNCTISTDVDTCEIGYHPSTNKKSQCRGWGGKRRAGLMVIVEMGTGRPLWNVDNLLHNTSQWWLDRVM